MLAERGAQLQAAMRRMQEHGLVYVVTPEGRVGALTVEMYAATSVALLRTCTVTISHERAQALALERRSRS